MKQRIIDVGFLLIFLGALLMGGSIVMMGDQGKFSVYLSIGVGIAGILFWVSACVLDERMSRQTI